MIRRFLSLWVLLLAGVTPGRAEPLLALVIGNAHYSSLPALDGCNASVTTTSAALRRAGWAVTELRDPSNGQVGAAIGVFVDALGKAPGASGLLYFCGYATGYDSRLFLLPAPARLQRPTDILTEGIVAPSLTGGLARAKLRGSLVVFDLAPLPGGGPASLEAAGFRQPGDSKGLFAALGPGNATAAPSVTASALAAALSRENLTVDAALAGLVQAVPVPTTTFVQQPTVPAWLQGAPAPEPVPPPVPTVQATEPPRTAPLPEAAPPPLPSPGVASPAGPAPVAPTPVAPAPVAPAPVAPVPAAPALGGPAAAASPEDDTPAELGDLDRRRVQLALQRLGYYSGKVDGQLGPESLAAIRRYQHELGAEMNGRLTRSQASRLLAQP